MSGLCSSFPNSGSIATHAVELLPLSPFSQPPASMLNNTLQNLLQNYSKTHIAPLTSCPQVHAAS